jgi:hypothetical protein
MDIGNPLTLKEKLVKRFINWTERNMSSQAKEVMIKSVAHAIPTYIMGVFKLPVTLCDELTQLIRQFWWGEEAGHKKVYWLAWGKLLMSKRLMRHRFSRHLVVQSSAAR